MKRRTNPTWAVRAALVVGLLLQTSAFAQQGLNNLWMGGYASWAGPPNGGVNLDFLSGSLEVSFAQRDIGFYRTNANITNEGGELLFSTNGAFVANARGDTMTNGSGLSPSWYTGQYQDGFAIPQGVLIIPRPEHPDIYYLFHVTIDVPATASAARLYYSVVDMSAEADLGAVASKNRTLIEDDLNSGKLTAVRHANGRDWWVFTHRLNTNVFHRLLVTPDGIQVDGTQAVGPPQPPDAGQVCFSPQGDLFGYFYEDLRVFPFDRCTGLFSEPIIATADRFEPGRGLAFSPSGRFLYISTVLDVYQFDMEAPDIAASETHIAHWDSTYSPMPPFGTMFSNMQLAPDGKIYIGTGNSTDKLHVIHNPDEPGLACNMEQRGIHLERYFSNSLPNHPNYHLGPVAGSVCDSLGLGVGMAAQQALLKAQAYPNPGNGQFNLSYPVQSEAGILEVLDANGRVVYQSRLAAWSQVHGVVLEGEAVGMYHCRVRWGTRSASTRIILTEP